MKKTILTTLITAATVAGIGASLINPAYALGGQSGPKGLRINFENVDLNGDGKITQQEISQHRAAKFAAQDTDGDGYLSRAEISAAVLERVQKNMDKRLNRMFDRRDTDGDGMISLAELAGGRDRAAKLFERLDTDGDGAISAVDLDAMKKRLGKGRHKQPASK